MLEKREASQQQIGLDFDFEQFSNEDNVQACRVLLPSLINKSSIQSFIITNTYSTELPDIPASIQKINLTNNKFFAFPVGFYNLKEIIISDNLVSKLPEQINDMHSLTIIRANHNRISILPFLRYIRHLEISNNPIKLVTNRLSDSRLQYLQMDWIPFLVHIQKNSKQQQILSNLFDVIDEANRKKYRSKESQEIEKERGFTHSGHFTDFLSFDELFCGRKKISILSIENLLNKAIKQKIEFFVQYLIEYQSHLSFNSMVANGKYLVEAALNNNQQTYLRLFKLKKFHSEDAQTYIKNLILACKYNNFEFFSYLIGHGLKRHIIQQNEQILIQTIFCNFESNLQEDFESTSGKMLKKIMSLSNFNESNKKIFQLPRNYSLREADCIGQGLLFVFKNFPFFTLFDFARSVENDIVEPLLHFAMIARKPELVQLILKKFNKPFVQNYLGKTAKSIRGSIFGRKIICKYEKSWIKQHVNAQNSNKKDQKHIRFQLNFPIKRKGRKPEMRLSYDIEPERKLLGQRFQIVEKQIHQKNMFDWYRYPREYSEKDESPKSYGDSLISDSTGCIYDFSKAVEGFSVPIKIIDLARPSTNILTLYESYHRMGLSNCQRDYNIKVKLGQLDRIDKRSTFFSFRMCKDVENIDVQREIIIEQKKPLCRSPCISTQDIQIE